MITRPPSWMTVLPHKSAWIYVNSASTSHNRVLGAINGHKNQKRNGAAPEIVEDKKNVRKSESVVRQSCPDINDEIATVLVNLTVFPNANWQKALGPVLPRYTKRSRLELSGPLRKRLRTPPSWEVRTRLRDWETKVGNVQHCWLCLNRGRVGRLSSCR